MNTLFALVLLLIINTTTSQSIIKTLPGYNGTLPFKLETGYISVGEKDEVQLFYYFVESEGDPDTDPLVLWFSGMPGCSGLTGLVYEIGPLAFDYAAFDGSLPSLILNPYSWTKIASIIFIDSPVGVGFSYATTPQGYASSDTKATNDSHEFIRKWFFNHPTFIKNRLYVAGESYGGKMAPMVALEIAKGNEAGLEPQMQLQGYMVGNSVLDKMTAGNSVIPYAHRMVLISDEYYELAKSSCRGEYVSPDPNNILCLYALRLVNECIDLVERTHILEPKCKIVSPKPDDFVSGQPLVEDYPTNLLQLFKQEQPWCRQHNYAVSNVWANDETVREALHVRKGTLRDWTRCNSSIVFDYNVESVVEHHRLLNEKGYDALAYSGDHDMNIPYMSTLQWIRALNLTVDEQWRPWTVDGQVAGYTEKYNRKKTYLTFATVKGAGHTAPEYKPKQCFEMVKRWLSWYAL